MRSLVSIALIISYFGVFYHDEWFTLSGVEHHHGSSHVHGHSHSHSSHHHGHSHSHHETEEEIPSDEDEELPFFDSHSVAVGLQRDVIGVGELIEHEAEPATFDTNLYLVPNGFDRKLLRAATEYPPPEYRLSDDTLYTSVHLAHCVQSNAPPVSILS